MANLLDTLYCSEEHWEEHMMGEDEADSNGNSNSNSNSSSVGWMWEGDMVWDEQELTWLVEKEKEQEQEKKGLSSWLRSNPILESGRREGVEWMLKVIAHYSFSATTALLAVSYFDRFLLSCGFQNGKPWMTQLAAVACLSLAAKVEETQVPLLLDLQVEETRCLFEAKTIKRMEILVLSTLGWKMNPPTPLTFLHLIATRLAFNHSLCWDFLASCEPLLLSLLPDSRFTSYLPSVMATATVMHVVKSVEPLLEGEMESQVFGILRVDKEEVKECGKVMLEQNQRMKRKLGWVPGSPNGVVDVSFSGDSSNDSWGVTAPEPLSKKSRTRAAASG